MQAPGITRRRRIQAQECAGSGAPARTLFIGIEGGSAEARVAASKTLAAAMRASNRFDQVSNGESDAWAGIGTWMFERRYLLSPAVTPEHFKPDGLREAIDETLSLLGTPAGNAIKPLLDSDPTGETQRIAETMIPETRIAVARMAPPCGLMVACMAGAANLGVDRVTSRR